MATAQIAARTLTARIATAPFDAGLVPVAPTSTATRLADRWLLPVRAIDSSFSAAGHVPVGVGTPASVGDAPCFTSCGPGAGLPVLALPDIRVATRFG